ncbi:MAG: hypothetical protein KA282_01995 [Clostridia bacterium]|nr:hypothetical protein [Clostridia bacterium]
MIAWQKEQQNFFRKSKCSFKLIDSSLLYLRREGIKQTSSGCTFANPSFSKKPLLKSSAAMSKAVLPFKLTLE